VFSIRPIRAKLLIGFSLLVLIAGVLSISGLYTMYAYRALVKGLSRRVVELPVAAELSRHVSDLRITLGELHGFRAATFPSAEDGLVPLRASMIRDRFRLQLGQVEDTLAEYRAMVEHPLHPDLRMADHQRERRTVEQIEDALVRVREANHQEDWILDDLKVGRLETELENLQTLAAELPSHLHAKMAGFAREVRGQYRTLIVAAWIASILAALAFGLFVKLFYQWIFQPLRVLVDGSRRVAGGDFDYRIRLQTSDEMAELAEAMNDMTARFQNIRDDLDRQVQERTKQVVRGEQLASVGFLAAGVAHEINNPLASIAICAESLQGRIGEMLDRRNPDHAVIASYLQMVQDEAFRCKEITEKLLDFSRIGQSERQNTDLGELVHGVVEVVRHLGKYQRKRVEFVRRQPVIAPVNAPQLKQVTLNLLTNALDSVEEAGTVRIELLARDGFAELTFTDDGCGIEAEVLEHVFEPFFTRRRAGQGTGLGLSISFRIVSDHGGEITAQSPGAGQGATFRVRLPLTQTTKENRHQHQAA